MMFRSSCVLVAGSCKCSSLPSRGRWAVTHPCVRQLKSRPVIFPRPGCAFRIQLQLLLRIAFRSEHHGIICNTV